MLVQHFLENAAARWPDKVALVAGGQRMTYREVGEAVEAAPSLRCLVLAGEALGRWNVETLKRSSSEALSPTFQRSNVPTSQRSEDDLAALVYTSGSTGQAKGVMCSHYNMVS